MSPDAKLDLQMARLKLILTFQDKYQVISNDVPWIQRLLGKRGLWKVNRFLISIYIYFNFIHEPTSYLP